MSGNKMDKILEMALLRSALDVKADVRKGREVSNAKKDKITKIADYLRKKRQGDSPRGITHSMELWGKDGIKEDEVIKRLRELEKENIWHGIL